MRPLLQVTARQLAAGDWVHLFPEGRIHFDGRLGPLRWGVGKLVCDAKAHSGGADPIILPFYHTGMGDVVPMLAKVPRVGKRIHVEMGQPLDLSHITCRCNKPGEEQGRVWADIAAAMHAELAALEARCPTKNTDQLQGRPEPPEVSRQRRRWSSER